MNLSSLTEVAALLAAHAPLFIEQDGEVSAEAIGDYYILSRNRFNRWMKDLTDLERGLSISDPLQMFGPLPPFPATRVITEQILVNEMIARIWTILLLARDRYNGTDRVQSVAQNVFLGHLSVRHKALSVVLTDDKLTQQDLRAIDRLRRSTERWTDLLCCQLMNEYNLWSYAFHEDVARDFLRDRIEQDSLHYRSRSWVLILAGMRHSFFGVENVSGMTHDDDRRLVRLMLDSFPEDAPEMTFWMSRRFREAKMS